MGYTQRLLSIIAIILTTILIIVGFICMLSSLYHILTPHSWRFISNSDLFYIDIFAFIFSIIFFNVVGGMAIKAKKEGKKLFKRNKNIASYY